MNDILDHTRCRQQVQIAMARDAVPAALYSFRPLPALYELYGRIDMRTTVKSRRGLC